MTTTTQAGKKAPSQAYYRNLNAKHANNNFMVRGKLTLEEDYKPTDFDDNTLYFVYSLEDPQLWNPATQSWIALPDKFRVTAHSPELARSEFFQRWAIYSVRRFGFRVSIENTANNFFS